MTKALTAAFRSSSNEQGVEFNLSLSPPDERGVELNLSLSPPDEQGVEFNLSLSPPNEQGVEFNLLSLSHPDERGVELNLSFSPTNEQGVELNLSLSSPSSPPPPRLPPSPWRCSAFAALQSLPRESPAAGGQRSHSPPVKRGPHKAGVVFSWECGLTPLRLL